MSRSCRVRLADIDQNIRIVLDLMKRRTKAHLAADVALRYAVQHAVMINTEAVRHLPQDLTSRYPDISWKDIGSAGNVIRHEYFRVDPDVMWSIVSVHLPKLQPVIQKMLQNLKQDA